MKKIATFLLMVSMPLQVLANQGLTSIICPSKEMVVQNQIMEPLVGTFQVSEPQLLPQVQKWIGMFILKNRFTCEYETTSSVIISLISPFSGTPWIPFIFPGEELSSPWLKRGFTTSCQKSILDCSVTRQGLGR